ncbi:hypothetical protein BU15DRAFT_80258 [Melanogaster broomeanus]|nr:hypothetical protein BU15DRAFT_80258 [Melanogaster broomeanus]
MLQAESPAAESQDINYDTDLFGFLFTLSPVVQLVLNVLVLVLVPRPSLFESSPSESLSGTKASLSSPLSGISMFAGDSKSTTCVSSSPTDQHHIFICWDNLQKCPPIQYFSTGSIALWRHAINLQIATRANQAPSLALQQCFTPASLLPCTDMQALTKGIYPGIEGRTSSPGVRRTNSEHTDSDAHSTRRKIFHPHLTAHPCSALGVPLPPESEPPAREVPPDDDWMPFESQSTFLLADFLYRCVEMSASNIDFLMEVWAFEGMKHGLSSPFTSHEHVYKTIDEIHESSPSWQKESYQIWYRDPDHVVKVMLENPDFADQFDYAPYHLMDGDGKRRWTNFMSGNYAWRQSDKIYAEDPSTEGSMYCGIILGSDKTTVSVATGQVEYHPPT